MNNFFHKYNAAVARRTLAAVGVVAAAGLIAYLLADRVLYQVTLRFLYRVNMGFADVLAAHRGEAALLLVLLTVVAMWLYFQHRLTVDVSRVINATDLLFSENEGYVRLPKGFEEIENKLNGVKQAMLQSARAAKEAEQKKDELVVYLAHDIKTPLTSIIGYLSLLNEEKGLPEELKDKYLEVSLEKAERLEELIQEFFEITRFHMEDIPLQKTQVNVARMLYQMTDEFYPFLAERGMRCEVMAPHGLVLSADADKLARVFENLLRNAAAYGAENSVISITAESAVDCAHITVTSRGRPIPPEKLEHLFDKFYRADAARSSGTGGAGLGLAIAREIARLHGGDITAKNEPDGTSFTVLLPLGGKEGESME